MRRRRRRHLGWGVAQRPVPLRLRPQVQALPRRSAGARDQRPVTDNSFEVDAHHNATRCRPADLNEARVGEHAGGADVEFLEDHVLRDDGVALDRAGAAVSGMVRCGSRERATDSALPESRSCEEAGHRPNSAIRLVFCTFSPWDAVVAQQALIGETRLDRAPAGGLGVEVSNRGHWSCARSQVAASRFAGAAGDPLLGGEGGEGLSRGQLVPLALASGCTCPRVPKTVCTSSQLTSLAGTACIGDSAALMDGILQVTTRIRWPSEWRPSAPRRSADLQRGAQPAVASIPSRTATAAQRAPRCGMTEISTHPLPAGQRAPTAPTPADRCLTRVAAGGVDRDSALDVIIDVRIDPAQQLRERAVAQAPR